MKDNDAFRVVLLSSCFFSDSYNALFEVNAI